MQPWGTNLKTKNPLCGVFFNKLATTFMTLQLGFMCTSVHSTEALCPPCTSDFQGNVMQYIIIINIIMTIIMIIMIIIIIMKMMIITTSTANAAITILTSNPSPLVSLESLQQINFLHANIQIVKTNYFSLYKTLDN